MFENGVRRYTTGTMHIQVHFPEDEVKCFWCRFCRKDDMGRHWCRITNEMLYNPQIGRGEECPIEIEER